MHMLTTEFRNIFRHGLVLKTESSMRLQYSVDLKICDPPLTAAIILFKITFKVK